MKSWIAVALAAYLLLAGGGVFAAEEPATKADIRLLIEQMDKRFEQIDRRFEQIDKRFEFIQALLLALFVASIGVPLWVERQRQQRSQVDSDLLRGLDRLLTAMREMAIRDPQTKELLACARLL